MRKNTILEARSITKSFNSPHREEILKDIDFSIQSGESVAIIGASGSGKSTLLSILGTLEAPSSGTLEFSGKPIRDVANLRANHIGFVFQSSNLLEEYTLLDNLLLRATLAKRSTHQKSDSYAEAKNLLNKLGLSERVFHKCKLLSGGEKQRGALARALMNSPDILFADEPTGNLDTTTSKIMEDLIFSQVKELNKSLLLVTHDISLAKRCDRVLKLESKSLITL